MIDILPTMPGFRPVIIALLGVFSALVSGGAIRLMLRTRLAAHFADTPNHRKVHSAPTPRVGGIAIIAATIAAALAWSALAPAAGGDPIPGGLLASAIAAAVILGGLGLLDDSKFVSIRVRHKLAAAVALAAATVFLFGVHPGGISVFGLFAIPVYIARIIAVLWIVGLTNAYNLIDGLDGFAGTVSILSLAGVIAVALLAGCSSTAALGVFALGAVAGFMAYNAPPAKVFMGDTGSCFLGYMVALLTIRAAFLMDRPPAPSGKVLAVMPLLAGLPILEVTVTVVRRCFGASEMGIKRFRRTLKHIVTADSLHLHHRFLLRGFSHLEACALAGTLAAALVASAVCAALAPMSSLPWIAAYPAIPVAVSLYKLGFFRFKPPQADLTINNAETDTNTKKQGIRRHKLFYKDLMTQIGLSMPMFGLLVYLIIKKG